jgi:putative DNA primase/helicase
MKIEEILQKLENVRPTGKDQWIACCPAHDDNKPSLRLAKGTNGHILFHCFAGCSFEQICGALEINKADLFAQCSSVKSKGRIVKAYNYTDESGRVIFQTVRMEPKDFRQRVPLGDGEWRWNLKDVRRVLYRLPDVLKADESTTIFITEGEKDADRLADLGLTATTCPMGAGKWRPEYSTVLQGKKVVILPDNDIPGRAHAEQVAVSLSGKAASLKILNLPGLPEKGDVSDYLDNGGTAESLLTIAKAADDWQPNPTQEAQEYNTTDSLLRFERTDYGAGEAFSSVADDFLFDGNTGYWRQWDGKQWCKDSTGQARKAFIQRVARVIRDEAISLQGTERASVEKYARMMETSSKITNALAEGQVHKTWTNFDADNFLINVRNGTIDLRTGQLQPHNRNNFISKICPVDFDPDAQSQRLEQFLHDVTGGDVALERYLQKIVGYSLTGDTREEKLFFVYGPKQSGKSTFIEALRRLLGSYAHVADFETFLKRPTGGIRNDIAALHGSRFVCSIEVDDGKALAEGVVKTLTGGDTVRARYLYRESFEFLPQFKLWLVANHRPRISDQDDAMWRRIVVLPFEHSVPPEKCDTSLKPYLRDPKGGGPALLTWAVRGALLWQAEGLGDVPEAVKRATWEYRETMDPVKEFFEDRLDFNEFAKCTVAEMRSAYENWCSEIGQKYTLAPRDFNERLEARGAERKTIYLHGRNQKCWSGVGILNLE